MKHKHDYTPPHDHEAEAGMLACVLVAPKAQAILLLSKLNDDLWDDPRHKMVYHGLARLKKLGKPLDTVALWQQVKDDHAPLELGFISQLADRTPSFANWPTYYDTIVDRAWRRRVLSQLRALALDVCDTSQQIKSIEQKIREISL